MFYISIIFLAVIYIALIIGITMFGAQYKVHTVVLLLHIEMRVTRDAESLFEY